jgi:hypothetical protein
MRIIRYEYVTGVYGLVAQRMEMVGPDTWALRRLRYLGRGPRAQRIVALVQSGPTEAELRAQWGDR